MEILNNELLENLTTLNKTIKFTLIAILAGIISYIVLLFEKHDLLCETDNSETTLKLEFIAGILGVIVVLYFFYLSIQELEDCSTDKVIQKSNFITFVTCFILVIIEIIRFKDFLRTGDYEGNIVEEDVIEES